MKTADILKYLLFNNTHHIAFTTSFFSFLILNQFHNSAVLGLQLDTEVKGCILLCAIHVFPISEAWEPQTYSVHTSAL